jgi:uncharacterized protein involved in type VI secretion and phage assembly
MSEPKRYFGKYRGTVSNNIDPEQRGRIQVSVPHLSHNVLKSWALPAMPIGGLQMGVYSVPPIGAHVWVEFEQGDLDSPIWAGVFWESSAEVPALAQLLAPGVPGIAMQTVQRNGFVISDVPGPTGGTLLTSATGAMILINEMGITISNGKGATIQLSGPSVVINEGALTVI